MPINQQRFIPFKQGSGNQPSLGGMMPLDLQRFIPFGGNQGTSRPQDRSNSLSATRAGTSLASSFLSGLGANKGAGSSVLNTLSLLGGGANLLSAIGDEGQSTPARVLGGTSGALQAGTSLAKLGGATVPPAVSALGPILGIGGGALNLAEGNIGPGLGSIGIGALALAGVPGAQMLAIPLILAALSEGSIGRRPLEAGIPKWWLTQQAEETQRKALGGRTSDEVFRQTAGWPPYRGTLAAAEEIEKAGISPIWYARGLSKGVISEAAEARDFPATKRLAELTRLDPITTGQFLYNAQLGVDPENRIEDSRIKDFLDQATGSA